MSVKNFDVQIVHKPTLRLKCTIFNPVTFQREEMEKFIPMSGLRLTEPVRGRLGGFKRAELLDDSGTVCWIFGASEQRFYDAVKAALDGRS